MFYRCSQLTGINLTVMGLLGLFGFVLMEKARSSFKVDTPTSPELNWIKVDNHQPKDGYKFRVGTTGWPKGSNPYGHRVPVLPNRCGRGLGRGIAGHAPKERCYCTDVRSKVTPSRLERLRSYCLGKVGQKVHWDLFRMLCDPRFLESAYNRIKSKPGNMTQGVVPETLDGLSYNYLLELSNRIRSEDFQFRPGLRTQIPKPQGGFRPLTIAPPRDKIVQEALRMLLECVFEPEFSTIETSHGFRPGKSCHTALNAINIKFASAAWMIEGDIAKCFDEFDHTTLMAIIESKISDRQYTKMLWKALKAGYMEFTQYSNSIVGAPQGSVVSPILSNIYLHELDKFVVGLKEEFDKGQKPMLNPKYVRLMSAAKRLKRRGKFRECRSLLSEAKKHSSINLFDPNYRRLCYVRYADDWVVGVRGSCSETQDIKKKIQDYCLETLKLRVSDEETRVTNLSKDKVLFLGTQIFRARHHKFHDFRGKGVLSLRRSVRRLRFHVPMDRIKKKLNVAGFLRGGESHPKFVWMSLSHSKIVALYNSVYLGYINYYSFAGNYSIFVSFLHFTLRFSLAKLLAAKYSSDIPKVFSRFGHNLAPSKGEKGFKKAVLGFRGVFSRGMVSSSINQLYSGGSRVSLDRAWVENHHVRMMKDLNPRLSKLDALMVKRNRKQIPLCRACHMARHRGEI